MDQATAVEIAKAMAEAQRQYGFDWNQFYSMLAAGAIVAGMLGAIGKYVLKAHASALETAFHKELTDLKEYMNKHFLSVTQYDREHRMREDIHQANCPAVKNLSCERMDCPSRKAD